VMVDRPGLSLTVKPATEFRATGPLAERARDVAERLAHAWSLSTLPNCEIVIHRSCRDHTGLGVGTQLGLAVVTALAEYLAEDHGRRESDVVRLARLAGRAQRSAVGTYGFQHGGLIVEAGKPADSRDTVSPLIAAIPFPPSWRFVLACPTAEAGLHGTAELRAFDELPPVPVATTNELCRLALLDMIPSARSASFESFSNALYGFGRLAGSCFAAQQGGTFASERTAQLVRTIRDQGIAGVGQTSWGPTVFALVRDQPQAEQLVDTLRATNRWADVELTIAAPCNHGARIERS
jgi:beta-ribofuranosylaminobenzene 5'-phosphate synthase